MGFPGAMADYIVVYIKNRALHSLTQSLAFDNILSHNDLSENHILAPRNESVLGSGSLSSPMIDASSITRFYKTVKDDSLCGKMGGGPFIQYIKQLIPDLTLIHLMDI